MPTKYFRLGSNSIRDIIRHPAGPCITTPWIEYPFFKVVMDYHYCFILGWSLKVATWMVVQSPLQFIMPGPSFLFFRGGERRRKTMIHAIAPLCVVLPTDLNQKLLEADA